MEIKTAEIKKCLYKVFIETKQSNQTKPTLPLDILLLYVLFFWNPLKWVFTLGWAQWNLSSFEFKFDDTRLSS